IAVGGGGAPGGHGGGAVGSINDPSSPLGADRGGETSSRGLGGDPLSHGGGVASGTASFTGGSGQAPNVNVEGSSNIAQPNIGQPNIGQGTGQAEVDGGVRDAQYQTSSSHAEAAVTSQTGAGGQAVMSGDAKGTVDARVSGSVQQADVGFQANQARQAGETYEANAKVEAQNRAIAGSGYQDEYNTAQNAQNERVYQENRVYETKAEAAEVKVAVENPTATGTAYASTRAHAEANEQINERAPIAPTDAQAKVDLASDAVNHPVATAESKAEVKIEADVSGRVDPTPKK
ncbi:MAG TPA: hypothetical protein VLB44_27125, partial [Kofleriaceae bacterium]|nr:hypothetical protein [Kofleriaceae bacterium]